MGAVFQWVGCITIAFVVGSVWVGAYNRIELVRSLTDGLLLLYLVIFVPGIIVAAVEDFRRKRRIRRANAKRSQR